MQGDVTTAIVVDHLDAVSASMRDEHAPRLEIERAVIEGAVGCVREFDGADLA
jgi:hypothetical protein